MPARPLLRSAVALLSACGGSATVPDPVPLPGNPKGARYGGNLGLDLRVEHAGEPASRLLFVEVHSVDGQVKLGQQSVSVDGFPVTVELSGGELGVTTDPTPVEIRAWLDADGDPATRAPGEPAGRVSAVIGGPSAVLTLEQPAPPPAPGRVPGPLDMAERPVYANTKGSRYDSVPFVAGAVAYAGQARGRTLVVELTSGGRSLDRKLYPNPVFPVSIALSADDPPLGARVRAWLDADGDPATRAPGEPAAESALSGSAVALTLTDPEPGR